MSVHRFKKKKHLVQSQVVSSGIKNTHQEKNKRKKK